MENSPRNKFAHLRMINEALCSALPLLLHRRSKWETMHRGPRGVS
jgi:hypothetical protein